jgi:hypothetical protein
MAERLLFVVLVSGLALAGAAGAARDPSNLQCPSMPLEHALPAPLARAERAFEPWGGSAVPRGLAAGPFYLVAGSYRTAISRDGDFTDSSGAYLHRSLVAVAPSFAGPVTITGGPLKAGAPLGFSTEGAIHCSVAKLGVVCVPRPLRFARRLTLPGGGGWRIVRTELRVSGTGCYQLTASGAGLHETIPLAVPAP